MDAVDRALGVFWRKGFTATSVDDLAEIGLNRRQIYRDYGSKQGLYREALLRYRDTVASRRFGVHVGSLEALADVLDADADSLAATFGGIGCMMANAAAEVAPSLPGVDAQVAEHIHTVTAFFRGVLDRAADDGTLATGIDPELASAQLATSYLGAMLLARTERALPVARTSLRGAAELVRGWARTRP